MISEVNGEAASNLVDTLTRFMNDIVLKGKVPDFVVPYFYGANLTALSKSDGGVRPIACGFTLRRLASFACQRSRRQPPKYSSHTRWELEFAAVQKQLRTPARDI